MSLTQAKQRNNQSGYKQTELGMIPEDWNVVPLLEVCRFRGGKAHEPYISESGGFVCVNSKYISTDGSVVKYSTQNLCAAKQNDILMVMSDLPNGKALAKAFVADKDNYYAVNQRICALTPYKGDNAKYLYYVLNRNPYFLKFDDGVSQTHLLNPVFYKCQIPLPPTKAEQKAIAEALSDADALIESLEQLIAKKRHIKQGAMQDLLTGKKRLAGFNKNWEYLPLRQVCQFIVDGTHFTPTYVSDGVPFYSVENVTSGDFTNTKFITQAEHQILIKRCKPQKGDILMTRIGSIGDTKLLDWDVNASIYVSLALLRPNNSISPSFLYAYTKSQEFVKNMEDRSLMNAIPKKINMGEIGSVPIPLPEVEEQHKIAEFLSDIDKEIEALEIKLAKAKVVKQGMMQDLLTGKVRLV